MTSPRSFLLSQESQAGRLFPLLEVDIEERSKTFYKKVIDTYTNFCFFSFQLWDIMVAL